MRERARTSERMSVSRGLSRGLDAVLRIRTNICAAVIRDGRIIHRYQGHNLLTTAGSTEYAKRITYKEKAPVLAFDPVAIGMSTLRSGATGAPADTDVYNMYDGVTATPVLIDSVNGYPKTNDTDSANSGGGISVQGSEILTWGFSWNADSGATGLWKYAFIHDSGATGAVPLLMAGQFSPDISVQSTDSLRVFVNHTIEHP